ncbi:MULTISPECIES: hypothetical protein [Chitinophagaceae]
MSYFKRIKYLLAAQLFPLFIFAQTNILIGKVVDSDTKQVLANATVAIGNKINATNNKGDFVSNINQDDLVKYGIDISYSGYLPLHLNFVNPDDFLLIELKKSSNSLDEVTVAISAKMIIERSIKSRPNNCRCRPYNLTAFQRTYQTLNDTVNFIKDDALLKLYVSSLVSDPDQVGVLQNRDSVKETTNEKIADNRSWDCIYITPIWYRAIEHCIPKYDRGLTIDDLVYTLRQTTLYNNRRTYIIDCRMADSSKEGIYGTMFIDCATYALVAGNSFLTKASIAKMNKKNKMKDYFQYFQVDYDLDSISQKWFLKSLHTEARGIFTSRKPKYTAKIIDFVTLSIDTINVSPISKKDQAKKTDKLLDVFKPASPEAWKPIDSIIQAKEYSKYFTNIISPSRLVSVLTK